MTSDMLFLARSVYGLPRLDKHDVDPAAELNELRELFEPRRRNRKDNHLLKERRCCRRQRVLPDVLSVTCFPMQSAFSR